MPFYTREEIDKGALKGRDLELVYLDPVELFFMQVQGSGRVRLADGTHFRLGYSSKNGHPYTSIGKKLVELGEGKPKSMSMEGIKDWLRADKERGKQADVGEQVLCVLPPARRRRKARTGRSARKACRSRLGGASPSIRRSMRWGYRCSSRRRS